MPEGALQRPDERDGTMSKHLVVCRSWDEKQRERTRLARLAMLERDNHHTDNTHMMKVQNLADDELVGGGSCPATLPCAYQEHAPVAKSPGS